MLAEIKDITFGEGKMLVQVDYFYEVGEDGYDDCYREIKDVVDEMAIGTGKWRLYPFNSIGTAITLDATKKDLKKIVLAKLDGFKLAHAKVADLQSWLGTEIRK